MKKTYFIDLDGTMYRGSQIIEGAKEFIDTLTKRGERFVFLTNNAKRTKRQNVEHMEQMGFTGIREMCIRDRARWLEQSNSSLN